MTGRVRGPDAVTLAAWVAFAAAAVAAVRTLAALGDGSFWFDELWTVWIVRAPDGGELIRRIGADVHPPLYYGLAWLWTRTFGLSEATLRLPSLIAAVAAVAILFVGLRRYIGLPARLLMVACAITSFFWLDFAAMARMYGLGLMLAAALGVCAIDLVERGGAGSKTWRLAAFVAIGFLAALTHFYLLLLVGAVFGWTLLWTRRWRDRAVIVGGGLAIVLVMAAYLGWLGRHTQIAAAWFDNTPSALWAATVQGVRIALAGPVAIALLAAAGVLALAGRAAPDARGRILAFGLFVPLAVIGAGIAVSLAVRPSYAFRNVAVAAPFVWIAAGALIDLCLTLPSRRLGLAVAVMVAGTTTYAGLRPPPASGATREEFRAAARFVAAQPGCDGRPIALLRSDIIRYTPAGLRTYREVAGYYLNRESHALPLIDLSPSAERVTGATVAMVRERVAGTDPCRVLAYGAHLFDFAPATALVKIARDLGVQPSRLRLIGFSHHDTYANTQAFSAWVLIAR